MRTTPEKRYFQKMNQLKELKELYNLVRKIPSPVGCRISVIFHKLKLRSIADLKKISENDLINQYSFGIRCYEELTKILKKYKIKLRML